jgi:hypothetical protein
VIAAGGGGRGERIDRREQEPREPDALVAPLHAEDRIEHGTDRSAQPTALHRRGIAQRATAAQEACAIGLELELGRPGPAPHDAVSLALDVR